MHALLVMALTSALCGFGRAEVVVSSLEELAEAARGSDQTVVMKPGIYRMQEYLTPGLIAANTPRPRNKDDKRPSVYMLEFAGERNRFQLHGVVIEIDTTLYELLPKGYTRCLLVTGHGNTLDGLTVVNTGPNTGSNGNVLSIFGDGTTVENITLHVSGSHPYGYGDLLGKGGPNLVPLGKQSGMMIGAKDVTVRGCRVISRAFGHCFYAQPPAANVLLEDCYAEGVMRATADMLRDTDGPAFENGFRSVYPNRDGRFMITAGYMKSLVEDGFRTYGNAGEVRLVRCTAYNTRAGFEVSGPSEDGGEGRSVLEGCVATGCERAYLLGSNVTVRRSRGDMAYGPLLYLRGGSGSDVELELVGGGSDFAVHATATIAGERHRVKLTSAPEAQPGKVPIFLGFGMPGAGEISSPFKPAPARDITLVSNLPAVPVIKSPLAENCRVEAHGPVLPDSAVQRLR